VEAEPTRTLVLLRHAKSAWPQDVPDRNRPLAPRGRRDAPMAGRWLRQAGCAPDHVLCSTARRARETWQLALAELGAQPPAVFEPEVYGASAGGLLDLVRRLPSAARTGLVVGHAPGLPELALMLAAGTGRDDRQAAARTAGTALDRMRAKFPTGAIAILDLSGLWSELAPGRARLTCFVTPREMHATRYGQQH
jgi:phosphohistidine phosphatase